MFGNGKVKIGIAFGGGGARGFTHLGAIKAFEEFGIKFDMVAGTSAGSIMGAFYAAGYSYKEMYEAAKKIREKDIRTNIIPFSPSKTDGIGDIVRNNLGNINENLTQKEILQRRCKAVVQCQQCSSRWILKGCYYVMADFKIQFLPIFRL